MTDFNFKKGFYVASGLSMIFLISCLILLLKDERDSLENQRFKSEVSDWIEANSNKEDSIAITSFRKVNNTPLFPGLLSDYWIVRKSEEEISNTVNNNNLLESEKKGRTSNKDKRNQSSNENVDHNSESDTQLKDLIERNIELHAKLDSYGYIQFKTESGIIVDYVGELNNKQPHGYGTALFSSGKRYEGNWENGKKSGEGIYYYKNNERYEGTFHNNVRDGEGVYYFSNGDRYIGSWKNDKRDGQGHILKKNGSITKKGLWKDDKWLKQ